MVSAKIGKKFWKIHEKFWQEFNSQIWSSSGGFYSIYSVCFSDFQQSLSFAAKNDTEGLPT